MTSAFVSQNRHCVLKQMRFTAHKMVDVAGRRWLTPLILATQEMDQEDQGLKPVWANSLRDSISKTPNTKMPSGVT
jgi:hypothetical protein